MIKSMMTILSPVHSGLFTLWGGSSGGGGGDSTQTVKNEPAAEVKPYLQPYISQAWSNAQAPYQAYQGQRIAGLDPSQQMGMNLTAGQALNGFQGQGEAGDNYQALMRGDYLSPDSNPWLAANAQKAMSDITNAYRTGTKPQTDAAAARAGAFGGSAWQQMVSNNERQLGDSLGNAANQFYGQNYANERQNQMAGLGMMGNMQNIGYTDSSKLTGVGDALRNYNQDLLNTQYQDWQEAQNSPYLKQEQFGNALRSTMGAGSSSTATSSNPYKVSPIANALGGALGGYGLSSALGYNGALGAGLGGAAGLLF